jgi:N-acetyl-1-D-myo-inositol-2-amino-2-deoxy-alpha-D-glucopyranoside deacetylase
MPGLLAFHAHPDDEVISTGGVLAKYGEQGHHIVVVTATDGAEGEVHNYEDPDPIKARLAEVRAEEIAAALGILGVANHHFLGYRDSGMMGTDANHHDQAFWRADFMEANARLVSLVRSHQPEVMIVYDPFGGYGHPDHIQVHRVGMAAFFGASDPGRFKCANGEEPWAPRKLYMTTWPRSRAIRMGEALLAAGRITPEEAEEWKGEGTPDEDVTTWIDVLPYVDRKIKALRAHRSQIPEDWFLLAVPEEAAPEMFGRESYMRVFSRVEAPFREDDLFAGLR